MADYSALTDQDLIPLLKKGGRAAFKELYNRYSVTLLRKLIYLLKDEESAKEILQDAYLRVWEKRELLDTHQSFRPYLFKIAENMVKDFFRKAVTDKKLMDHLISISTELYQDRTLKLLDEDLIIQQALAILPEQRRKIFTLCKLDGKSYEEVATQFGISKGTVNDHVVKAMRTLRAHFKQNGVALFALVSLVFRHIK